ncbi:MAG: hypothetical protein JO029_06290 [Candidatus Eremiobacteraeota bacterium]|nr:hypothetical protein [Candidatus Eremiobacteraeota bacterium]
MTDSHSRVEERVTVPCPYHLAQGYLDDSVRDRASSREGESLKLRLPMLGAELTKNVVVTFSPGKDPMHFDRPWRLQWTPENGGPYPDFEGQLTVRADEDYSSCILELLGEYRPPGGVLGAAFDRAVGRHIASATGQALLQEIAAAMVDRYWRDESAKGARS